MNRTLTMVKYKKCILIFLVFWDIFIVGCNRILRGFWGGSVMSICLVLFGVTFSVFSINVCLFLCFLAISILLLSKHIYCYSIFQFGNGGCCRYPICIYICVVLIYSICLRGRNKTAVFSVDKISFSPKLLIKFRGVYEKIQK